MILEIVVTTALVVLGAFAFISTMRSRRGTGDPGIIPMDPGGPIQSSGTTGDVGHHGGFDAGDHHGGFDGGGGFHGGGGFDGGVGGHHGGH